jgi:hypothetical protein
MSMIKNSNLKQTRAFYYQTLVVLEKCFEMDTGQSVWIEKDGDVSTSTEQVEVKQYSSSDLTDGHENFWKTLKNWLADDFDHTKYSALILWTTQDYGSKADLKDWNSKNTEDRMQLLESKLPSKKELNQHQSVIKEKISTNKTEVTTIIAKISITANALDENELIRQIKTKKLGDIPESNKDSYLESLLGFIYAEGNQDNWEISKKNFDEKRRSLTSTYCRKTFSFPTFEGNKATPEQIDQNQGHSFITKIKEIEYHEEIPIALGNWLEFAQSLTQELDGYPQYRDTTKMYQKQLSQQIERDYKRQKLQILANSTHEERITKSKIFYSDWINKDPTALPGDNNYMPPLAYKNGAIHDELNSNQDLKWKIEP